MSGSRRKLASINGQIVYSFSLFLHQYYMYIVVTCDGRDIKWRSSQIEEGKHKPYIYSINCKRIYNANIG